MQATETWRSDRLGEPLRLVRWGEVGVPVLVFAPRPDAVRDNSTAGLTAACQGLVEAGDIQLCVLDVPAPLHTLDGYLPDVMVELHHRYRQLLSDEVLPALPRSPGQEPIVVGIGLGGSLAVGLLCREPHRLRAALALSGVFDLGAYSAGRWPPEVIEDSPLHLVRRLQDGPDLDRLRRRYVLLATGTGRGERPGESWWLGEVLADRAIPHRVDNWPGWGHGWRTWTHMLPGYLAEIVHPVAD